jgi:hypothetical protein
LDSFDDSGHHSSWATLPLLVTVVISISKLPSSLIKLTRFQRYKPIERLIQPCITGIDRFLIASDVVVVFVAVQSFFVKV